MSSILRAAFLASCLALGACATTTGHPYDTEAASHFEDGKTTEAQVRRALGEPETAQDRGGGTTMWVYSSSKSGRNWRTYVPFAALGAHGSSSMQALSLVFDSRGVLESHTAMRSR